MLTIPNIAKSLSEIAKKFHTAKTSLKMVHKNTRENKTFGTILSLAQALQMFSG
jgi:hypothetical protein